MAQTADYINLILNVQGADEVEKLRNSAARLEDEIKKMGDAFVATNPRAEELSRQLLWVQDRAAAMGISLKVASADVDDVGNKAALSATKLRAMAMIVDRLGDMGTGSFRGMIRNLGSLHLALLPVGVVIDLVARNWDQISKALGLDITSAQVTRMEVLKSAIEELNKKEIKLSVDHVELDNAKKELDELIANKKAFDDLMNAKPGDLGKSGAEFKKVLTESGEKDKLMGTVLAHEAKAAYDKDDKLKELGAEKAKWDAEAVNPKNSDVLRASAIHNSRKIQEQMNAHTRAIFDASRTKVEGIFAGATSGDVGAQEKAAAMLKGAGASPLLLSRLKKTSPQAMKEQAEQDEQEDRDFEEWTRNREEADRVRAHEKAKKEQEAKKQEKTADDYAKDLGKSLIPEVLAGKNVSNEEIAARLKQAVPDASPEMTTAVIKKIQKDYEDTIKKKQLEKGGVSREAAVAELNEENRVKKEKDDAQLTPDERAEKKRRADNQRDVNAKHKRINSANHGVDDQYAQFLLQAAQGGFTDKQADEYYEKDYAARLMRSGQVRDPLEASSVAHDKIAGIREKLGESGNQATMDNTKVTEQLNKSMDRLIDTLGRPFYAALAP